MAEQELKENKAVNNDQHNHADGEACGFHGHDPEIPSFHTRELIVKDDIMAKAKELANALFQSEEVQHYRRAEQQINGNLRIQELIANIKKKQKEVVAFETTFKNADMVKKIETEMAVLQEELDGIPIVSQFQQSQSDINYLLQLVTSVVRDTVSEQINVENAVETDPEDCSD